MPPQRGHRRSPSLTIDISPEKTKKSLPIIRQAETVRKYNHYELKTIMMIDQNSFQFAVDEYVVANILLTMSKKFKAIEYQEL